MVPDMAEAGVKILHHTTDKSRGLLTADEHNSTILVLMFVP